MINQLFKINQQLMINQFCDESVFAMNQFCDESIFAMNQFLQ